MLTHKELKKLLEKVQLHVLPSRSEGFPKVILETAAAGVPSVVYPDYGAEEWITHNQDGFIVENKEQIAELIKDLQRSPDKLQDVSENAVGLAKRFDWQVVVKDWEREIERMVNNK
jgi:glycosyltransferase involved in cell wall biosynthesis